MRLLKLERVGVADNFFELGGNSLLGIGLLAALRRVFQDADLPPHILYEAPTVETLAGSWTGPPPADRRTRARRPGPGAPAQVRPEDRGPAPQVLSRADHAPPHTHRTTAGEHTTARPPSSTHSSTHSRKRRES